MDDFDRHFAQTRKLMIVALLIKLAVFAALIGLAAHAIRTFAG